jgi:hypothetical protein
VILKWYQSNNCNLDIILVLKRHISKFANGVSKSAFDNFENVSTLQTNTIIGKLICTWYQNDYFYISAKIALK